jgi:hypothetical protein
MTRAFLHGSCRCGAVKLSFASMSEVPALPLLICSCDFCQRHRLRYTTDPAGRLQIAVRRGSQVWRYGFDGETAVSLVCAGCGAVIGALLPGDDGDLVALNVGCLVDASAFTQDSRPLDYDTEPPDAKLDRRRRNWTPAVWEVFEA